MFRSLSVGILFALVCLFMGGCSGKPAPDVEMVGAPTGLWIGDGVDIAVEIQDGGFFRITQAGQEVTGSWEPAGDRAIRVTLGDQTFELPYSRADLEMSLTLPGSEEPTRFVQM